VVNWTFDEMRNIDFPEIVAHGYRICCFDEEDANHIIALDFQERVRDFLQVLSSDAFPNYSKPVEISFYFVSGIEEKALDLDIFVTPVSKPNYHAFCIAIPIKVVGHLTTIFTALEVGPNKVEAGLSPSDIDEFIFRKIYHRTFAALVYSFLHEFSHIRLAHIPFLSPKKYNFNTDLERLSLGQLTKPTGLPKSRRMCRLHRAIEIDADLLAIQYIIEFVTSNNLGKFFQFSSESVDDPVLFGSSLYIFMQVLELWRQTINGAEYSPDCFHPHPDIRSIFLEGLIMMRTERKVEGGYGFEEGFVEGMKDAASQRDKFGHDFLPEFKYLKDRGIDAVMKEYDVLRLDLTEMQEELRKFSVP
jgi:hypothetical protein